MLNGSILICGGNKNKRKEIISSIVADLSKNLTKKQHPDLLIIKRNKNKKSIGIKKIREAILFLSTKPYSEHNKVIIIESAQRLTTQAQNALLKTLEEPPKYAVIILEAKTEESLLPTVISRCRRIIAHKNEDEYKLALEQAKELSFGKVLGFSIGEKLDYAEKLAKKEKEYITDSLENWIIEERQNMKGTGNSSNSSHINIILDIKKDLEETNVNTRLALECLLLSLN